MPWELPQDLSLQHAPPPPASSRSAASTLPSVQAIANLVPTRNHTQCLQRWKRVLCPGAGKKGQWSKKEDLLLRRLVSAGAEYSNWRPDRVADLGRIRKQSKARLFNRLDPNVWKGGWTDQEDTPVLAQQRPASRRKPLVGDLEDATWPRAGACEEPEEVPRPQTLLRRRRSEWAAGAAQQY